MVTLLQTPVRRWSAAVAALVLAVTVVAGPAAGPASAWSGEHVEIDGRGWGHGRGMGQYGALGYAIDHGWNHRQILDHFYGGTSAGVKPDAVVSVHLTAHDNRPLIVRSANAFVAGGVAVPAGEAAVVQRRPDGRWQIDRGPGCGGPWTPVVTDLASTARPEVTTSYGGDDRERMLRICTPTGSTPYRGAFLVRHDGGVTRVGNILTMQRYLRGVVPREMPASWGDLGSGKQGMEALKAQAVAARSFAWAEAKSPFQTCDTTTCQVYGGANNEDYRTDWAIGSTDGEVRVHPSGSVARAEFSSSTGGHTAGGAFTAVPDEGDDTSRNPNRTWRATLRASDVGARFGVGQLVDIAVIRRNGLGADGGRVLEVQVRGTTRTVTVSGASARSILGLKSDWFSIRSGRPVADVGSSEHRPAIEALIDAKIVEGCTPDRFCPAGDISREQMATLLDRALPLAPTTVDAFDDDDGSVHEAAINRVAAARIVEGMGNRAFRPGAPVARDQMASILTRAFRLRASDVLPFVDVPAANVHLPGIRAVAAAEVTAGCTVDRYCPGRRVTRAQAASLLARALGLV